MPNFRYRALTQSGEIVNGTISAPTSAEVARRIEYLRLVADRDRRGQARSARPRRLRLVRPAERGRDHDVHPRSCAAAEGRRASRRCARTARRAMPTSDGCVRSSARCATALLSGESFADALAAHPALFPADVCRSRAGRRNFRHADQVLEMLGAGAGAGRADAAKTDGCDAISGLCAGCRRLRHAVLHPVRAAAVLGRAAGFRREIGHGARYAFINLSEFLRANATAAMLPLRRLSSVGAGGCCDARARAPPSAQLVANARRRARFSDSIAPACSAAISASCLAAA